MQLDFISGCSGRVRKHPGGLLEGSIHATQFYDWEAKEAGVTAFCEKPLFMSQLRELLSNPVPKEKTPEASSLKHFDEAGMNGHLVKPVSREKLLNMIHKILKK